MSFIDRSRDRWANLHPLWRGGAILTILAAVALTAVEPALGIFRKWRTDRNLTAAHQALALRDYAQARELSLQVLRADASRQPAIPVLLHATDALGDPRRAEVALGLLGGKDFSTGDRKRAWEIACRSASTWYVLAVWPSLEESERADPEFVGALFDRLLRDDMPHDAARLLQQQKQPLPPDLDLRLMKLLVRKGTDEAFREFQKSLIDRLATAPDDAAPLVELIDDLPQSSLLPGTFVALSTWHETRGTPDTAGALRLARCHMAAAPEQAPEIFRAALEHHRGAEPVATARWCLQTRNLDVAAILLADAPPDAAGEAFELRCQLAEQTADLETWAELLADPPPSAFFPEVSCDRAYVASRSGDNDTRDTAELDALRVAGELRQDDALIRLARRAEFRGLDDFARRAWIGAIRRGTGPLPLASQLKHLVEALAAAKKETEMLEVLTTYRFVEPGNPVIIVQHGYLSCLTGRINPDHLIRDLEPIHAKLPDALPVRCVLALGRLLENQAEEALRLTDAPDIDWISGSPAYRAIRGLALAANGRADDAARLLDDFRWDVLLPSEERVLSGLARTFDLRPGDR